MKFSGRMYRAFALALACVLIGAASAQAQAPVKVLVFHGPPDATTTAGVAALEQLGAANDFDVDATADATQIAEDNLAGYRAVVFLNTAGNLLDANQEGALQGFVEAGGGFLGIGSAAQGEMNTTFFDGLIGARPSASSSTATTEQTVTSGDRVHPSTRDVPLMMNRSDVWYQWQTRPTGAVHTVARYRAPAAPAGDGTSVGGTDHPISWCRDFRGGRSFYTGMGRIAAAYGEAGFKDHLLGAIEWTAGLLRSNCKATLNSSYRGTRVLSAGPASTGLATSGESHGLAVAPNGWVIYIGRGDCRTDAERGSLLGGGPLARTFDHANVNVGLGCGSVHVFDPAQYTGQENSGVTLAGKLAVYGDGGQGGERTDQNDHKMEYGLLGVTTAPDFMTTGHIYLQYFPTFNPASSPPGLPVERRISKLSRPRISRFTIDRATKRLDLSSEVIVFDYDAQIYSCCHVGGGMGFDSDDNLYVTTGDTNSSQGTNGYSGNNQTAKCPTGTPNEASRLHCGASNYSYQDARRTAGNTNDYNGKLLRIKPIAAIPDGAKPPVGIGTTYTLPSAASPNGPNLFDGTEGGGGKAKPEIYAMGLRNPSRLSIDPETDVPYTAWVGPDAGAPSVTEGPSTYENAAQVTRAGNYGWPYCMGNKQAYRDRIANGTQRTTNVPGYVSGGPATGGTDGWYDCDNLVNDSTNNTGLTTFPHVTGTGADAGKVRGNNLWYSRGNPGDNNGCPNFPRDRGAGNAPNYGATPVQLCPYARNNGMTIMNGPVYRYQAGADNSRRWPEYWDGRWFLHNNGGDSIKHGVVLDPATAGSGGQPIYADSLRSALSWQGSYMDSKFGPDGALYVQTYDGFFRAGPNVGIYRFDYVGGAPTPGSSPRAVPRGSNRVQFSVGNSGGVSYQWEFGDGATSTEANPTHTYAQARRYTARLTVTYADGATDTNTVDVDVLGLVDETAPVTTATVTSRDPGAGGTYKKPVTVALSATDNDGGSGVERTEYRINGGSFQRYTAPITRQQPGEYVVQYRSTDRTGNVEATKTLTFTIVVPANCPTNLDDEFPGPSLDPKWEILRGDATGRSFEDGRLKLLVRAGDLIGGTASAQNVLLQDAPDGQWGVQTKLDVTTLTDEGEQAGIVLWNQETGPNTFAKIVYINKGANRRFEYVATRSDAQDIQAGPEFANTPDEVFLRVLSDGEGTYYAEGSFDGEEWLDIAAPIANLGSPSTLKFGIKVSDNVSSTTHAALFDHFRVNCSDHVAPTTSASLSPAAPDGRLGWYKTSPTVTLAADDGQLGEVESVEYRIDGGETRKYGSPFTVTDPGAHVVTYWATDSEGNVEQTKRQSFRVDTGKPVTTATTSGDTTTGPVSFSLAAQDGDKGSGTVLTQYRVDGGPWQTYSAKDEQIFDGTEASFAQWRQAPDGRFDLMTDDSGGITPVGGLGMLWYPVKAYGDFRLKLEFREGRTDAGFSNGGVFVRFPDPRAERTEACSKFGDAATEEAWVAIYCGHEIQLYDGPDGETRKTGSIYTFDNNSLGQIGPKKERGEWEDYEIQVVGQTYEVFRNGVSIKKFENSPGKASDRGGDPGTSLRQFTRGFIGLQNHGGADTMQYRNIRVEDLSPDALSKNPTGPFTVSGAGPHTVEVRSVDAAGNIEDKEPIAFEIGRTTVVNPLVPPTVMPPMIDTPASYRLGRFSTRLTAKTFARRGLRVPVACTGAMTGSAKLTVSRATARKLKLKRRTLDSSDVQCYGPHTVRVTLKPSSALARALGRKGGPRTVRLTLAVQMRDWGKPATTTRRTITLRRR